ncbi:FCD domain-containing protein [Nonomuraea phyllanthi]|uniref:FCD domain-containing protein n=1 Tax=Nonomuraea phyllanthi TaxID=2219224 RepID=A0A5C4UVM0_9ACTN|nr:GntR family transcriptional regulator [Nonomuraea phyllanthi]KAB8182627.1 FCD domain-containing protein [Nonomuraea phyllanthi]
MSQSGAPLRRDVAEHITGRIVDGRLPAAARVNEVHLAAELGVSRTPLREALVELADRGLLVAEPNRGFRVPPLDLDEARKLYPLVGELEALALRWTAPQDLLGLLDRLEQQAEQMEAVLEGGGDLSVLDDNWHGLLLSACANAHLMRLIVQTKPLLKRYDVLYFGGPERARRSLDEHRRILAAIRAQDLNEAARQLTQNWANGAAYLGCRPR